MLCVYIAAPFRGNNRYDVERNIQQAADLGFKVARAGCYPVIPHTMYGMFDGTVTDEFWLRATAELLARCDAAVFACTWLRSTGCCEEMQLCNQLGLDTYREHAEGVDLESWLERLYANKLCSGE